MFAKWGVRRNGMAAATLWTDGNEKNKCLQCIFRDTRHRRQTERPREREERGMPNIPNADDRSIFQTRCAAASPTPGKGNEMQRRQPEEREGTTRGHRRRRRPRADALQGSTIYRPSGDLAKKSRSYKHLLANNVNQCFQPNPNLYSHLGESRVDACVCVERGRATAGRGRATAGSSQFVQM